MNPHPHSDPTRIPIQGGLRSSRLAGVTAWLCTLTLLAVLVTDVHAGDKPRFTPEPDDFSVQVNLDPLRTLSVQHEQVIKTWDTWSRQTLRTIAGKSELDGYDPLYLALDIAIRPEQYVDRNIIRINNVPLRKDIRERLLSIPQVERDRILHQGKVSLAWIMLPQTQQLLAQLQTEAVFKSNAIAELSLAASTLKQLADSHLASGFAMVPPIGTSDDWLDLHAVEGNIPQVRTLSESRGRAPKPRLEGYDDARLGAVMQQFSALHVAWQARNVGDAQVAINKLGELLPGIVVDRYPPLVKRQAEVVYNRSFQFTLLGAAIYFVAFVLFIMSARATSPGLRWTALGFLVVGLLVHTLGVVIRWWLTAKSTDDVFHSIPIKNQFEAVMMCAWFGAVLGLVGELAYRRGFFGAAASFVGWLALVALFTVPYVFGKEIGGQLGQVNGILMSYWLYIHVTLAVFSYALIAMCFLLGVWWLISYARNRHAFRDIAQRQLSADAVEGDEVNYLASPIKALMPAPAVAGIANRAASPGVGGIGVGGIGGGGAIGPAAFAQAPAPGDKARAFLARLDLCNLVTLQLAFIVLGVAVVCGAVWADVSWGRPWGWDPKETFALVTWIVYLVILHVRLVTRHKAMWTAVLCIVGFFVMLFNWIGVNYFLIGLHSYA